MKKMLVILGIVLLLAVTVLTNQDILYVDPGLSAGSCSNSTEFQNVQGTFQAYNVYIDMDENMDEFKPLVVTCGMNPSVPDECKDLVEATIQNISVVVNGTILDHMFSKHYRPNIKQFGAALHFERHEKAEISCITTLKGGGALVSDTKTVSGIDELHPYKIVPGSLDVTIGQSYELTCVTDTTRGLEELSWTLWNDLDGFETPVVCKDEADAHRSKCKIENMNPTDLPASVLTVSTIKSENFNTTVEYTYRCNGASNHTHQHKMLGEARVTVHPRKDNTLGIGLGVAAGIVVLGVLILAAATIFRRSKLTTVMTYAKLEEPEI